MGSASPLFWVCIRLSLHLQLPFWSIGEWQCHGISMGLNVCSIYTVTLMQKTASMYVCIFSAPQQVWDILSTVCINGLLHDLPIQAWMHVGLMWPYTGTLYYTSNDFSDSHFRHGCCKSMHATEALQIAILRSAGPVYRNVFAYSDLNISSVGTVLKGWYVV